MTTSDTVETFSSLRPIEASIPTHSDSHERPRGSNLSRHTGHPPIPPQCRHICHPVLYVGPQLWLRRVVSHPNAAARTYGDLTSPEIGIVLHHPLPSPAVLGAATVALAERQGTHPALSDGQCDHRDFSVRNQTGSA